MSQPVESETRRFVIIGAGFSGSVLAARLLREAQRPTRVILINRSGRMARGVAYGTRSDLHVLNVPAGRMSALPENEGHFLDFARSVDPSITGATFVVRSLYGDYLQKLLEDSRVAARSGVKLEQMVGDAVDLELASDGVLVRVGDQWVAADAVVLASGNFPPADPGIGNPAALQSGRYVRDPWAPQALAGVKSWESVLLIGTGLTMYDVALELTRRNGVHTMHAISRRGLVPQPHRRLAAPPADDHVPPDLLSGPATALDYLRSIRRHVERVRDRGIDWRDILASIRGVTPQLWQRLSPTERRRFLLRLRPYWDVHRHRAAPEIASAVRQLVQSGMLTVSAGRIAAAREHHGRLEITVRPRGGDGTTDRLVYVERVINCTGPDNNIGSIHDPLLQSLHRRGLVRPDEIGVGLEVTDDYRLLRADGSAQDRLFLLGPLLRGRYWEATAVPELRVHAAALCRALLTW